ncbi:Asp-tRNA(Asn)/Glu-tRNA(Gln) amidotransferase subunit GatB [Candidatus Parcubacteria bacterium]|nr:MAG: Asp-tRNA(Asn)/Glu-tRNA(Gln) amidotransferase subunit GatB [Candidatus Parcubacteria bacterium]
MAAYKATIGLEIHAELKTRTKMFCASRNDAEEQKPNVNICPVCLAHPGTLPVINKQAVAHVLRVGAALDGQLADYTEFDRKNYFYPDLPKGYQISQYEFPLVSGGQLSGVKITRVHLEEDTASSMHSEDTGETLIDFNRAGVPLMELVTDPVIESAEQAGNFARELQLLLRYLGASDANMEKGEMRVEANISVSNTGELGTKVEVKNLNSFRAMERAIEHEIKRQVGILESGQKVLQETRGWDEGKQATFAQRVKEGSADYRYFPDPDLPSLKLSELSGFSKEEVLKTLPELPRERRERYIALGIKQEDADLYVRDTHFGDFFDRVATALSDDSKRILLASNYIANDLVSLVAKSSSHSAKASWDSSIAQPSNGERDTEMLNKIPISEENFIKIISLIVSGKLSSRGAKDLLVACVTSGGDPETIAKERNLILSDMDVTPIVEKVLRDNPKAVEEYKAGKTAIIQFLVGMCMKEMKGAGNPATLRDLLEKKLQ